MNSTVDVSHVDRSWTPDSSRWARWFVILASVSGVLLVFTTPPLAGADEYQHIRRVAYIDQGWVVPPAFDAIPAGYRLDGCLSAFISHNRDNARGPYPSHWADQFTNPPCGEPEINNPVAANIYSPVPYVAAVPAFRVGSTLGGPAGGL